MMPDGGSNGLLPLHFGDLNGQLKQINPVGSGRRQGHELVFYPKPTLHGTFRVPDVPILIFYRNLQEGAD